jgi:hypothetical protein
MAEEPPEAQTSGRKAGVFRQRVKDNAFHLVTCSGSRAGCNFSMFAGDTPSTIVVLAEIRDLERPR